MVRNQHLLHLDLSGTLRLRDEATELLERLKQRRELSERIQREHGKRDPMRFVTGRTALECAIETTRSMVDEMDQLLREMNRELEGLGANDGMAVADPCVAAKKVAVG